MFCTQCGKEIVEQSRFCPHCGSAVSSAATAPVPRLSSPPPLPGSNEPAPPGSNARSSPPDEWDLFFNGLNCEGLRIAKSSDHRFEFSGERTIKAFLSRTTVRYQAVVLLNPSRRHLKWWEKLSESSFGIKPQDCGVSFETSSQRGTGLKMKRGAATPGAVYSYEYGGLRETVETHARACGWTVERCAGPRI